MGKLKCAFGHEIVQIALSYPDISKGHVVYDCGCADATSVSHELAMLSIQEQTFSVFVRAEIDREYLLRDYVERFVSSREARGLYDHMTIGEIFELIQAEKLKVSVLVLDRVNSKSRELFGTPIYTPGHQDSSATKLVLELQNSIIDQGKLI